MRTDHLDVNHPLVSLGRAAEQLLLVEDHAQGRWCPRCAEKHARAAAALAEEALSLSQGARHYERFALATRYVADLAARREPRATIASHARTVRRAILDTDHEH